MIEDDIVTLRNISIEIGASFAEVIKTKDIILDIRASFKCWACPKYGKNATCPPNIASPEYFEKLYKKYQTGILIGKNWDLKTEPMEEVREYSGKSIHKMLLNIEKQAINRGYYFAIVFIGGSCRFCTSDICGPRCSHPESGRIPLEATGVDVLKTCEKFGHTIKFPDCKTLWRVGLLLLE